MKRPLHTNISWSVGRWQTRTFPCWLTGKLGWMAEDNMVNMLDRRVEQPLNVSHHWKQLQMSNRDSHRRFCIAKSHPHWWNINFIRGRCHDDGAISRAGHGCPIIAGSAGQRPCLGIGGMVREDEAGQHCSQQQPGLGLDSFHSLQGTKNQHKPCHQELLRKIV